MLVNFCLDTPLIVEPGMDDQEIDELWRLTFERSKMTQAFLDRKIDAVAYLDWMEQSGIDAAELLDTAQENLEFAISDGIVLER
jgi:hypothetical protein